jgi:pilus assembly protein CpaC
MRVVSLFLSVVTAIAAAPVALAQAPDGGGDEQWTGHNVIEVSLGGSTTVGITGTVGRVTLTDPKIADVSATGRGLLIVGRQVGETNLIMFGASGQASSYLVKVSLPARAIQSELERLFPGQNIDARAVGGSLVLVGTVSDTSMVQQVEDVALGFLRSPSFAALGVQPNVINLLHVRGRQQVMLEVKFAEVKRTSLREMGVNAVVGRENGRFGAAVGQQGVVDTQPRSAEANADKLHLSTIPGNPGQFFNPAENAMGALFIGKPDGKFPFAATLSLLAQRSLARTLAEPTLIAMSGQTAKFLAGGEVPFTVANLGGVTVEFKPFGIQLDFTPTVESDDSVQLKVDSSVSAIDPTLTTVVPTDKGPVVTRGFKTRSSETTVRLRDGQSFAIAGLLNDEMNNVIQKVPGLGDLPILGALFSSKSFQREETELLVVVTAHLVQPMDSDALPPLPGENQVTDPTDLELFLLNVHETDKHLPSPRAGADMTGFDPSRQPAGKVGFWR